MGWLDKYFFGVQQAASNGTLLPVQPTLNFGAGLTAVNNPITHVTTITGSGTGGSITTTVTGATNSVAAGNTTTIGNSSPVGAQFGVGASDGETKTFLVGQSGRNFTATSSLSNIYLSINNGSAVSSFLLLNPGATITLTWSASASKWIGP